MLWAGVKLLALVSDCHCEWLGWQGAARALRGTTCRVMCRAWRRGRSLQGSKRSMLNAQPSRVPLSVCLPAAHT